MRGLDRWLGVGVLIFGMAILGSCRKEYEAVPDTACTKLVAHSRALLGEGIKDKKDDELLAVCKASTPKQRGCVMAATVGADIMKCSLVRD